MIKKKDILLAILSGLLLVLSFPPFDLYPLAWVSFVPLMVSLLGKNIKTSFFLGTLTGFICFIGTIYWVFNSMYFYSNLSAFLSLFLLVMLCLYLGAYTGVFSVIFNSLSKRSRFPALFLAPVIWVTLEFLRTCFLTGFPWSVIGYSQYKFLMMIQIADITGVYGISFLVVALNGAIFDVMASWPKRLNSMPLFNRWPMTIGLLALALLITISLLYGSWRLQAEEKGQEVLAGVIQGNFEQDKKWDEKFQREIIDAYKRLSVEASAESPDIIVWPESALPFVFGYDESLTSEMVEFQKTLGTYLLFGNTIIRDIKDGKYQLSNSAVLMSPEGKVLSTYDKIHLVPYGEYVPLRKVFPFIERMVVGIGDFVAGKEYTVMDIPHAKISNLICYEVIFPDLVRKFADNGATLFVVITNDAWFGRTAAPYQHFSMAVLRAIENRVPVVRAANTGVSGFIDAKGRIKRKSDIFVEAVLVDRVKVGSFNKSFYTRYGDLFTFFCIISLILLIAENIFAGKSRL